ncbi:MAG: hypothetical protein KXJ50_10585 [Vulcanococcus sp.]|jgi:hypothetical protein|uniref:hypothetical protein n=1 Tax=Vulcanococcus sp. TaxID=2856995 RepID=UPI0025F47985|nr:hypothetical protein [Vulcanococcus sp.]MBW0167034.1 hypothetical protein [Vulcanococcus sp.]MBW0172823.1 hypothetical protein [Vulcanococcus sp.]MBW0181503.1 hypothetical protein [Vulcanococcus sp.]
MYRLEIQRENQWKPVARGLYRTRMRAVTAALWRTAEAGSAHRVVDVELKSITDVIPEGSIQRGHQTWRGTEPPS